MEPYPLHSAVLRSDTETVQALILQGADLDALDSQGYSPLHWAVLRGDDETVALLLKAGANPNVFSGDGYTPMWSAADFSLEQIMALLGAYGGKIKTNDQFNRTAWSVFKNAVGEPMPEEESHNED